MRYQPRDNEIVWEAVEGEVLLIDLAQGIYYSLLQGTGQLASDLLHGLTTVEIVNRWTERFPGPAQPVEAAVERLTAQMLELGLLAPRDGLPLQPPQDLELSGQDWPPLERYDDMKEIFEMDPIHDGDLERGWPVHN